MRRAELFLALLFSLLSCQVEREVGEVPETGVVKLSVAVPGTKVYGADDTIQNLSIFAFSADGRIAARLIDTGMSPTFRIPLGETISIWAIANWMGVDLSYIEDEQSLKDVAYTLDEALYSDGEDWHVLMTAHVNMIFTSATQNCSIALDRAVAEVRVGSVTLDMDYLTRVLDVPADEVQVDGLYLINCVDVITLGGEVQSYTNRSGNCESGWYQDAFSSNDVGWAHPQFDSYHIDAPAARTLEGHVFYSLPNPAVAEFFEFDDPWTPRPTRVVLSLYSEPDGWLEYPVTIISEADGDRGLFANTRYTVDYNISEWTGYWYMDRDPDYSFGELYFNGWTIVNLSETL